jgi:hypothetical protein
LLRSAWIFLRERRGAILWRASMGFDFHDRPIGKALAITKIVNRAG